MTKRYRVEKSMKVCDKCGRSFRDHQTVVDFSNEVSAPKFVCFDLPQETATEECEHEEDSANNGLCYKCDKPLNKESHYRLKNGDIGYFCDCGKQAWHIEGDCLKDLPHEHKWELGAIDGRYESRFGYYACICGKYKEVELTKEI